MVESGESNAAALAVQAKFELRAAADGRLPLGGAIADAAGQAFF